MINEEAFEQAYKVFKNKSQNVGDILVSHDYTHEEREAAKLDVFYSAVAAYLVCIFQKETKVDSAILNKAYKMKNLISHDLRNIPHDDARRLSLQNLISCYLSAITEQD